MGWLDTLKDLLGREATAARDAYRAAHDRLDARLSRREADLAASPEERLARMVEELDQQDDAFDEVRARIERLGDPGEAGPSGGSGSRSC